MFTRQAALLQGAIRRDMDLPNAQDTVAALCNCGQPIAHRGPVEVVFDPPPLAGAPPIGGGGGGGGGGITAPPPAPEIPPTDIPSAPPIVIDFPAYDPIRWDDLPFVDVPGGSGLTGQPGLPGGGPSTGQPSVYPQPSLGAGVPSVGYTPPTRPGVSTPLPGVPYQRPPGGYTVVDGSVGSSVRPGGLAGAYASSPPAIDVRGGISAGSVNSPSVSAGNLSSGSVYNSGGSYTGGPSYTAGPVNHNSSVTHGGPSSFLGGVTTEGPVENAGPVFNRGPVTNIGGQLNAGEQVTLGPAAFFERVSHGGPVEHLGGQVTRGPASFFGNVNNFGPVTHQGNVFFNGGFFVPDGNALMNNLIPMDVVTDIDIAVNGCNIELAFTKKTAVGFAEANEGVGTTKTITAGRTTDVVTNISFADGTLSKTTRQIQYFGCEPAATTDADIFTANGASFDPDECEITTDNGASPEYTPLSAS